MSCPHLKKEMIDVDMWMLVEHKAKWATSKCPDKEEVRWEPIVIGKGGKKVKLQKKDDKGDNPETGD